MRKIGIAVVALLAVSCDSLPQQRDCAQPTEGYLPPPLAAQSGVPLGEQLFSPVPRSSPEAQIAAEFYAAEIGEDAEAVRHDNCFWIRPVAGQRCVYFATKDLGVGGDGTYCFDSNGQKTFEFLGE